MSRSDLLRRRAWSGFVGVGVLYGAFILALTQDLRGLPMNCLSLGLIAGACYLPFALDGLSKAQRARKLEWIREETARFRAEERLR